MRTMTGHRIPTAHHDGQAEPSGDAEADIAVTGAKSVAAGLTAVGVSCNAVSNKWDRYAPPRH